MQVRAATEADLEAVAAIQEACPEAAHWPVRDYLQHTFLVAGTERQVAGFLVFRSVAEGESEILNLAVSPDGRRQGIGGMLLEAAFAAVPGTFWLEVRESNSAAQKFYQVLGFQEVGRRAGYYENPPETAVVMKSHSCYRQVRRWVPKARRRS